MMTAQDLDAIIESHRLWLAGCGSGSRADLRGADLRGADFHDADLRAADLRAADLRAADLRDVCFCKADLRGTDLRWANLRGTNLRRADLRGANLPSPTMVLLASWWILSDELTRDLMAYDASCHPDPQAFARWAKGGPCPYDGVKVQRAANFRERRDLYEPREMVPPYELMRRVLTECCVWADAEQAGEGGES